MTIHEAISYRKAERHHNEQVAPENKSIKFSSLDFDTLQLQKNSFRPKKSLSVNKIVFSPQNEILSYSYKNPDMKLITPCKAKFPQLEKKTFLNINFAYLDLDVSVRECSIVDTSSYEDICARFETSNQVTE
jgi:hypothetical protein